MEYLYLTAQFVGHLHPAPTIFDSGEHHRVSIFTSPPNLSVIYTQPPTIFDSGENHQIPHCLTVFSQLTFPHHSHNQLSPKHRSLFIFTHTQSRHCCSLLSILQRLTSFNPTQTITLVTMVAMTARSMEKMEELLKPQQFDWADEFDEDMIEVAGSDDTPTFKPQQFDWAEDVEDSLSWDHATDTSSDEERAVYEVDGDIWLDEATRVSEPAKEPPYCVDEEDPVDEEESEGVNNEHQNETIQSMIAAEFWYRSGIMHDDKTESIHHFNWYGQPVGQYSDTHPAHSLMFILSGPKRPGLCDENRVRAILNRACLMVDPVIYTGGIEVLSKTGQDLVNAVINNVYKFYTPHGWWRVDADELEEQTVEDDGMIDIYQNRDGAVANGFYDHPLVPTRSEKSPIDEPSSLLTPWQFHEKRRRPYSPSSLHFSTYADTEVCPMKSNRVRRVRGRYQWWEEVKAVDVVSSCGSSMMSNSGKDSLASSKDSSTEVSSLKDGEPEELDHCEPSIDLTVALKPEDDIRRLAEPLMHQAPEQAEQGDRVITERRKKHQTSLKRPTASEDIQYFSFPEPSFAKDSKQTKPSRTVRFKNFWKKVSGKLHKSRLGEQRTPVPLQKDCRSREGIGSNLAFHMDWSFLL